MRIRLSLNSAYIHVSFEIPLFSTKIFMANLAISAMHFETYCCC